MTKQRVWEREESESEVSGLSGWVDVVTIC